MRGGADGRRIVFADVRPDPRPQAPPPLLPMTVSELLLLAAWALGSRLLLETLLPSACSCLLSALALEDSSCHDELPTYGCEGWS